MAPATRQQISSVLVNAQEEAGHGIQVVALITRKTRKQIGVLFVDDTNLWEGLLEGDGGTEVLLRGQNSVNSWGNNLLAVGGELRPEKCSYTVHSMRPTKNGEWEYVQEKSHRPRKGDGP